MSVVVLYSRPGCHLCEEVKHQLESLRRRHSFELLEVNIDLDTALRQRYNEQVPVVTIDGELVSRYRLNPGRFLAELKAAGKTSPADR